MNTKLLGAFLLLGVFHARPALSSAYYNNEFFTRITRSEVNNLWTSEVDAHSFLKDPYTCEVVLSTNKGGVKVYKDLLNTETIKEPPTIVIVPRHIANQSFLVDIRYVDFTTVLDIPVNYTDAECYIVPPYKPLMYVGLRSEEDSFIDIYALKQGGPGGAHNNSHGNCNNRLNAEMLKRCKVTGPPLSYDYPSHPFFLTASRSVARNEISLFTIISIERLHRLVDLAENWNWPISAGIGVSDPAKDISLIMEAWFSSPEMRRNVDIHLMFDDKFPIVKDSSKLFPINYLRDLAFKNTRSELVMFVEGDYVVNKEFKQKMISRIPLFLNDTHTLYITPAFDAEKGIELAQIPKNKQELIEELNKPDKKKKIQPKKYESYKLQNISHWVNQNETYDIVFSKGDFFEPYFVTHRNTMLYDEIFNSYGYNKLSQVQSMQGVGFKMKMLPDTFMVHLNHNSIKNYTMWYRYGYQKTLRYVMKYHTFRAALNNLKGLTVNRYFPPWLEYSVMNNCSAFLYPYKCKDLTKVLNREKSKIRFLKNSLILLSLSFGLFLLFVVTFGRKGEGENK